jgi:hypothetical protein
MIFFAAGRPASDSNNPFWMDEAVRIRGYRHPAAVSNHNCDVKGNTQGKYFGPWQVMIYQEKKHQSRLRENEQSHLQHGLPSNI